MTRGFGVATREEDVEAHAADLDDFTREKERALDAFEREIGRNIAARTRARDRWEATAAATAAAANASPIADDPERRSAIVREALALAPRSRGALTVEDVLRLLPDFTEMDEVRDAVLAELERFRARAESSRRETNANLALAAEIEAEMAEMESREVEIRWDHPCASCGGIISAPPAAFAHYAALGQDPEAMAERSPSRPFFSVSVRHGVSRVVSRRRGGAVDAPEDETTMFGPHRETARAADPRDEGDVSAMGAKDGGEEGRGGRRGAGRGGARRPRRRPAGDDETRRPRRGKGERRRPKCARGERRSQNRGGGERRGERRRGGGEGGRNGRGANRGADAGWDPGAAAAELEDLLCAECPYCGEMMLRQIDAPFITEDDAEEAELWKM